MALPEDDRAGECLSRQKSQGSQISDDGQQWEDFTRVGRWDARRLRGGCLERVVVRRSVPPVPDMLRDIPYDSH